MWYQVSQAKLPRKPWYPGAGYALYGEGRPACVVPFARHQRLVRVKHVQNKTSQRPGPVVVAARPSSSQDHYFTGRRISDARPLVVPLIEFHLLKYFSHAFRSPSLLSSGVAHCAPRFANHRGILRTRHGARGTCVYLSFAGGCLQRRVAASLASLHEPPVSSL